MKLTGAEFMDWYDNHFPDGYYFDHDEGGVETHDEEGAWALDPHATYSTDELGWIAREDADGKDLTIDGEIRRLRRTRDFDLLVVHVPKARRGDFDAAVSGLGLKVQ